MSRSCAAPPRRSSPPLPLKMPGSKRRTFAQILPHLPRPAPGRGVVIPFFGTGADSWYLHDAGVRLDVLGDGNPHLVSLLRALRDQREATLAEIARLAVSIPRDAAGQRAWYYAARGEYNSTSPDGTPEVAARGFLVWRMAFNGLMRCGPQGINAASGANERTGPRAHVYDPDLLARFAQWLGEVPPVDLADYRATAARAQPGDLLYLDPPYVDTFDGYFGAGFDADVLVAFLRGLPDGVRWAMSNAEHERWARDFPDAQCAKVARAGSVSCKADGRQAVGEVLLTHAAQS